MPAPILPLIAAATKIPRAAKLAKQVLGTNRNMRNRQIAMDRMLPGRAQNISEQVLRTPRGGLVDAGQVMARSNAAAMARSNAVGMGPGAIMLGGGALVLSQTDPNDLGREMARMNMTLQEGFDTVRQKASDLAAAPQVYFMQVEQAYKDEMQRQQEMQNMQQYGAMEEPELESGEIKPVSLLFAGGGPAISGRTISNEDMAMLSPRDRFKMLGESGRTMSNKDMLGRTMSDRDMLGRTIPNMDREILANRGRSRSIADVQAMGNEPRFEDRPPENQIFSIDTAIGNLMTEYDMVVRNQEFERAQMIADQIDLLQQQKIQIQNQNVPQGRQEIDDILQSISI